MGKRQLNRSGRLSASVTLVVGGALAMLGCTSDPAPALPTVTPESAYIAIVEWEVERTEPVVDGDGNVELPIVYLASALGGTVDVGVQAAVIAGMDETAVIRFADDPREARDEGLEGQPVKDDGVMIVLNEFDPDQSVVNAQITRYVSETDEVVWMLEVTAVGEAADVTSSTEVGPAPT